MVNSFSLLFKIIWCTVYIICLTVTATNCVTSATTEDHISWQKCLHTTTVFISPH